MSLPRPSGIKAPSKIGRPSGIAQPKSGIPAPGAIAAKAQRVACPPQEGALAKSARAAGIATPLAEKYATQVLHSLPLPGPEPEIVAPPIDDFKIGDRIFVGGTKLGTIAFIGETQFAAGEWAGVVLDDPIGKNDGSVAGVRYFQCEPKRGVFARLTKLTRTPGALMGTSRRSDDAHSDSPSNSALGGSGGAPNGNPQATSTPLHRPTTPRRGLGQAPSDSNTSLNRSPLAGQPPSMTQSLNASVAGGLARSGLKVGDRVLVSGSKPGILRYLGATDFAKGNWAGVELDEPLGKNDGAVAGKRYFDCKPMYGLFAPVHKVTKVGSATPSPQSRSLTASGLRSARERSGSQESVSSISSTASSVSRSRVRLGVTSLANQASKSSQRPSTLNLSATTAALQKALKEKEEHIEQLLRERDLERAEVARAAEQVDETEKRLMSMHVDHERLKGDAEDQLTKFKTVIRELEKEKQELILKLEDERRKVEDLQFQIEEETISKDDLECRSEADEAKLKQLERNYEKEKARAEKFEGELTALKRTVEQQQQHLKSGEETQTAYLDQIEELTYKLTQAENKIQTYESSKLEDGAKTSQVSMELAEKAERVHSLEDQLSARNKEVKTLKDKMLQMEDELKTATGKNKKLEDTIVELNNKVKSGETNHTKLNDEIRDLRSQQSDLQQRLDTSLARSEELSDDKAKLEQQLADLMKNSGDSSKQLSMMNEQLMEKSRKVEEVQNDLSSSTQKILKLNDTVEKLKQDSEREKEELVNSHREELAKLQAQLEDSQTKIEKLERHTAKLEEDSEQEKQELVARKDGEIAELKKTLAERSEELSKQEVQTQAHKQVLDSITLEKEAMKFEKEKAEKAQKRLEAEKAETSTQLAKSQVEVSKLEASLKKANASLESVQEQLQDLQDSQERAVKARQEAEEQRDKLKAEKEKAGEERDTLHQDLMTARAELQKNQIQVEEAQKEVDRLKTELAAQREELMTKSQSEQEASDLSVELTESRSAVRELQGKLAAMEAERDKLKADLEYSKLVLEERKRLEDQNANLQKQVEETNKRLSEEVAARESEKEMLTSQLSNSASKLQKQEQELQAHRNKISNLQNENMTLAGLKQDIQQLELQSEQEKKDLLDKIRLLEKTLADSRANANVDSGASGDPALSQMQQEKDAADKQIEFLNSVIVDMQKKNADLKVRLEAMEAGVLNGSASSAPDVSPSRRAAPRLFCDICDMFDLHDTDDCPKQAMSEDSPPPTSYHGDRKQLRPYCDTCEDFDPEQRHIEGASDVDDADYTEHALSQPLPSEAEALKLLEAGVEKTPSRTSIDDITLLQGQGTVGWKRQRPKFQKIESESEPELVEAFDNSDDDGGDNGEGDADDETEKEEKGDTEVEKDVEMVKEEAARGEGRRDVIEEETEEEEEVEEEEEDQTATDGDVAPKQQPFTASLNPLYTSDEEHPDMSDSSAFNTQPLATLPYSTGGSPKKPAPQETPSKKQEKKAEPAATDGDALAPLPNVKAADPLAHATSMTASYPPAGKASGAVMTSAEESDVTKGSDVAVAQTTGTLEGAPKPGWRKGKAKARPVSYAGAEEEKGAGQAPGQQKEDSCVVS